ncbi:MAG: glutaminyl-peptide cyclotransferase [Chitinispirillia bacterium]|nr:glutaminyl-peptide cyclotransferase [Chitinispirillia bacterium]MCL2241518.1 glutaminyl-peptide cyclotransferase [Chitinispirillia bacterium]
MLRFIMCRLTPALIFVLALAAAPRAQWRAAPAATVVKPEIVRTVKHDPAAFTQGLILADTVLYESTGLIGRSSLRMVNAGTGAILKNIAVPDVFAEGITIFGGELVQLTWKDRYAIRYNYPSLTRKPPVFRYDGEGWGLTNDGASFIMSNGTDTVYFRNEKFEVTRKVPVTLNGRPLLYLNELQYARGMLYANVWLQDFIAEIPLADGRVSRVIDCTELRQIEGPRMPPMGDDVLNGIAWCEGKDEWYLTGKNWKNMFVVRIPK